MPALTAPARVQRLLRLPVLLLAVLASLPLGVISAAGATDWGVCAFCRVVARSLGLRVHLRGALPATGCLIVANHVGYLDILALGSCLPGRFLAKTEIAGWPLLGWLARCGGVVFVDRDSARDSRSILHGIARQLRAERQVVLFPEGQVSPDGCSLRPFRPMLFQACVAAHRPVVPVAVRYRAPTDPRVWAWVDEPSLWRHLWRRVLSQPAIEVEVVVGAPIHPRDAGDRKQLAVQARRAIENLLCGQVAAGSA